jgi:hypothetical protein
MKPVHFGPVVVSVVRVCVRQRMRALGRVSRTQEGQSQHVEAKHQANSRLQRITHFRLYLSLRGFRRAFNVTRGKATRSHCTVDLHWPTTVEAE